VENIQEILDLFCKAIGMQTKSEKLSLITQGISIMERYGISHTFPFNLEDFEVGLKYLGFHLKANQYKKTKWLWLQTILEKKSQYMV